MAKTSITAMIVAGLTGALIWALSPEFTGYAEPWDADGGYYPLTLLAAGIFCGISVPRHLASLYLGAVLGQLPFMLFMTGIGAFAGTGLAYLMLFTLTFLVGAVFGERFRQAL